jgi:tetratricopeptide (TPR) repeat protein
MAVCSHAQFVWPKPEYNIQAVPGTYKEDAFVVEWRKKFFSVFRGEFSEFEQAYQEIQALRKKNPKDARFAVWTGNGHTVKAGLVLMQERNSEKALQLLAISRTEMNEAVRLSPDDPNIYMMRAATLYIQGQYFPAEKLPREVWTTLRDDSLKFIRYIGNRLMKTSIHLRGEAYGSLGIAYSRLGERQKAIAAFERLIEINPNTEYAVRARREIASLKKQGG